MNIVLNKSNFEDEFKRAVKNIKQANKGFPYEVKICKDYTVNFSSDGFVRMVISYLDGDCHQQTYTICL